jgi:hypothetical protein
LAESSSWFLFTGNGVLAANNIQPQDSKVPYALSDNDNAGGMSAK